MLNLENLKINNHDLEELFKLGISKEDIQDAVESIDSLEQFIVEGNKVMAKRVLNLAHKSVVRIIRKLDYDFELEHELEVLIMALVKYIKAIIEGDEFDIRYEKIGFEYQIISFKNSYPDFEW